MNVKWNFIHRLSSCEHLSKCVFATLITGRRQLSCATNNIAGILNLLIRLWLPVSENMCQSPDLQTRGPVDLPGSPFGSFSLVNQGSPVLTHSLSTKRAMTA